MDVAVPAKSVSITTQNRAGPGHAAPGPAARGRPRGFCEARAIDIALGLFHEQGYDAVGVAALCEAIGIKPPSLYAAFGSKLGLFERVLARYAASPTARALADALTGADDPCRAVTAVLEAAASAYAVQPDRPGCLVLFAELMVREPEARTLAERHLAASRTALVERLRTLGAADADALADAIVVAMRGLSASARAGMPPDRLRASAAALARSLTA